MNGSRLVSSWCGAAVLTHSLASWIAPAHPLPLGFGLAISFVVALWATWERTPTRERASGG